MKLTFSAGIVPYRIENDTIVEHWDVVDQLNFLCANEVCNLRETVVQM